MSEKPLKSAIQPLNRFLEIDSLSQVHEAEQAASEARRLAEIEAVVKHRIATAVSDAVLATSSRAVQLVNLIRALPELHTSGDSAIAQASEVLLAPHEGAASYVGLFVAGKGECQYAPFFHAGITIVNGLCRLPHLLNPRGTPPTQSPYAHAHRPRRRTHPC